MKEYERSFKVESINPYIEYCKKNDYTEVGVIEQNRIVYENRNNDHIIARLTTEKSESGEGTILDFKNVGKKKDDLKISNESIPLVVTEDIEESVMSILNVLEFYEAANNYRKRYIFKKNNVTFEIDDYISPKMQVIAIEGEEVEVEKVYNDVLNKIQVINCK